MRTFGELVGALDGVADITVTPIEDLPKDNFCAYDYILNNVDHFTHQDYVVHSKGRGGNFIVIGDAATSLAFSKTINP